MFEARKSLSVRKPWQEIAKEVEAILAAQLEPFDSEIDSEITPTIVEPKEPSSPIAQEAKEMIAAWLKPFDSEIDGWEKMLAWLELTPEEEPHF